MSDIWDNVLAGVSGELEHRLWRLRQDPLFEQMGSEIEKALAATIILTFQIGEIQVVGGFPSGEVPEEHRSAYFLAPQHQIGKYRADFVFGHCRKPTLRDSIVIECDGHAWHEKTKEQAAKDKARDRFLSAKAGRVIHFTGSEIFRDPSACLWDVAKVYAALHDREEIFDRDGES